MNDIPSFLPTWVERTFKLSTEEKGSEVRQMELSISSTDGLHCLNFSHAVCLGECVCVCAYFVN